MPNNYVLFQGLASSSWLLAEVFALPGDHADPLPKEGGHLPLSLQHLQGGVRGLCHVEPVGDDLVQDCDN